MTGVKESGDNVVNIMLPEEYDRFGGSDSLGRHVLGYDMNGGTDLHVTDM